MEQVVCGAVKPRGLVKLCAILLDKADQAIIISVEHTLTMAVRRPFFKRELV